MYCSQCGKEIGSDVSYCPVCGTSVFNTNISSNKNNNGMLANVALIMSYITSPIILVLRFLFEEKVRWSPSRGEIAYDMMLTPAMKIVVGILAVGLIVFSNVAVKGKEIKNKKVLKIMNLVNIAACALIIMFSY